MTVPGQAGGVSTPVLVAGGGPAGLAAAAELSLHGIACVVFEPRTQVSHRRPRAKTTSIRTMEHLRRWGIADRLRAAAPLPVAWSQRVTFCESLSGRRITDFDGAFGLTTGRSEEFAVYRPAAAPGARLPHAWFPDGTSLYDRLGTGFTLLGPAGRGTCLAERARGRRIPLVLAEPHRAIRGAMTSCWYGRISTSRGGPATRTASTWMPRRAARGANPARRAWPSLPATDRRDHGRTLEGPSGVPGRTTVMTVGRRAAVDAERHR